MHPVNPSNPATPVAVIKNHTVTLFWKDNQNIAKYRVYRGLTCNKYYYLANTTNKSYLDKNPIKGSSCYEVTALLGTQESKPSNSVKVIVP